ALFNDLADLVNQPVRTPALQRFAAHVAVEFCRVFGFLFNPTVDATNWRAEQALRQPWSIAESRAGNLSPRGVAHQQILAGVAPIARVRGLDVRTPLNDLPMHVQGGSFMMSRVGLAGSRPKARGT